MAAAFPTHDRHSVVWGALRDLAEAPTLDGIKSTKDSSAEAVAELKTAFQELQNLGVDADASLQAAVAGILGKAGQALEAVAPALVFAAPAAIALAALMRQCDKMASNKPLCGELRLTVVAVSCIVGEVAQNDAVARTHAGTLSELRRRVVSASALVQKIGGMGLFRSFISAGSIGAQLQAYILGLTQWTTLLTAAIGAGMEARLAVHVRKANEDMRAELAKEVRSDVAALRRASSATGGEPTAAVMQHLQPETDVERDEFSAEVTRLASRMGVRPDDARAAVAAEVARGAARHDALMAGTREVLRAVEGAEDRLNRVLADMSEKQAAEARELKSTVDRFSQQMGGVANVVEGLQAAILRDLRAVLAEGGDLRTAGDAAYRRAVHTAAANSLREVKRIPHDRVVLFNEVGLGDGASGTVCGGCLLFKDSTTACPVAIKRLKSSGSWGSKTVTPEQLAAFAAEIKLQYSVSNKHGRVVQVYGICDSAPAHGDALGGGEITAVLGLMACPLSTVLYDYPRLDLPMTSRVALLRDVAAAIAALHESSPVIVHGDIKSDNILLDVDGRSFVGDFGLASARAVTGTVLGPAVGGGHVRPGSGTPEWMAPELHRVSAGMREPPTHSIASDVYAFGMLMYEVLARRRPFEGRNYYPTQLMAVVESGGRPLEPRESIDGVPPSVINIMRTCWDGVEARRPHSMADIVVALKEALYEDLRVSAHYTLGLPLHADRRAVFENIKTLAAAKGITLQLESGHERSASTSSSWGSGAGAGGGAGGVDRSISSSTSGSAGAGFDRSFSSSRNGSAGTGVNRSISSSTSGSAGVGVSRSVSSSSYDWPAGSPTWAMPSAPGLFSAPSLGSASPTTSAAAAGGRVAHEAVQRQQEEYVAQLFAALREGDEAAAFDLIERCDSKHVNERDKDDATPLHYAAHHGWAAVASRLLDKGAIVSAPGFKNREAVQAGATPLHQACLYGHTDVVTLLLDNGASIHATTKDGSLPLHRAAQSGHIGVAEKLLAKGSNIHLGAKIVNQKDMTPRKLASTNGHAAMVKLLKEHEDKLRTGKR